MSLAENSIDKIYQFHYYVERMAQQGRRVFSTFSENGIQFHFHCFQSVCSTLAKQTPMQTILFVLTHSIFIYICYMQMRETPRPTGAHTGVSMFSVFV